jgi:hypothetical protein
LFVEKWLNLAPAQKKKKKSTGGYPAIRKKKKNPTSYLLPQLKTHHD